MNKQQGFTLFEVLVSMFIASVAILGLALLEIKILKSAQSSFDYTVASIHANTLVDDIWLDLCAVKKGTSPKTYTQKLANWKSKTLVSGYQAVPDFPPTAYNFSPPELTVKVQLTNTRFESGDAANDAANNVVTLTTYYPTTMPGCN